MTHGMDVCREKARGSRDIRTRAGDGAPQIVQPCEDFDSISDQINRLVKFQLPSSTRFELRAIQSFRRPRFCWYTLNLEELPTLPYMQYSKSPLLPPHLPAGGTRPPTAVAGVTGTDAPPREAPAGSLRSSVGTRARRTPCPPPPLSNACRRQDCYIAEDPPSWAIPAGPLGSPPVRVCPSQAVGLLMDAGKSLAQHPDYSASCGPRRIMPSRRAQSTTPLSTPPPRPSGLTA